MSTRLVGQVLGRYRVVRILGEGGMGVVYEVVDTRLDRRAALKILRAELARDPQISARFLQEAKAASKVVHPGVVHIYEFGQTDDGVLYFVMEYLDGETLSTRMQRAAETPARRLGLSCLLPLHQVAKALAAVHKLGFIHRDLKPSNIMIVPDSDVVGGERAKVLDFGIVKAVQGDESAAPDAIDIKTQTGLLLGTPQYMAPEQWKNLKQIDGKVDVYALGLIAFLGLAGRPPFMAEEMPALGMQHCFEAPPKLSDFDPKLPADLLSLVARMLEKEPARRLAMAEVAEALGQLLPLIGEPATHLLGPSLREVEGASTGADEILAKTQSVQVPLGHMRTEPKPEQTQGSGSANATPQAQGAEDVAGIGGLAALAAPPPNIQPRRKATPTAPTLAPVKQRLIVVLSLIVMGASVVILAGVVRQRQDRERPAPLRAPADLSSPADMSTPPDMSTLPDMSTPPDMSIPRDLITPSALLSHSDLATANAAAARPRCTPRPVDGNCIITRSLTTQQRGALQAALRESGLQVCPGERLTIRGLSSRPALSEIPPSASKDAQALLLFALKGLTSTGGLPDQIQIRCSGR